MIDYKNKKYKNYFKDLGISDEAVEQRLNEIKEIADFLHQNHQHHNQSFLGKKIGSAPGKFSLLSCCDQCSGDKKIELNSLE